MHFGLTEEQELLQETLRRFASETLPPNRLREQFDLGTGFDAEFWRGAAEVGLTGLVVPEAFGGAGLELLDLALAFEVLGEAAAPGPMLGHALTTLAIARGGSEDQKRRWLPGLASGEIVGGAAFGEAGDRWDPEDWSLLEEDGRLTGAKTFAELGPHTQLLLVGCRGRALAIVETAASGLRIEPVDGVDRGRALAHAHFEAAPGARLDGPHSGPGSLAEQILDAARILLAAESFGAAWKLIRTTVDYAQTREQFSTPIAQFQAVKHQLANMAMEAEPMRGLVWIAAYAFDHRPEDRPREACLAKAHITDRVVQIGREAVALHGGIGFTWECDVHFWLKRAMHDRTWLGGPTVHRERLARLADW